MTTQISSFQQNFQVRQQVRNIQFQLDQLQLQISSGKKSDVYSGLKEKSKLALDLSAQKTIVENYRTSISSARTRMGIMDSSLTEITEIATKFKAEYLQSRQYLATDPTVRANFQESARSALRDITRLLNVEHEARYLFSGREVGSVPMVDPGGTAVATDPIAVLSTVINTTGASNYVANGAQTCLDSVVTTLTPSTTTDYTGTAPNTYPYNGDHTTFTNVSPFTAALTVRADRGTDIGYTVRGDDTSLVALFQGLYIFATANFNSTASNSFFQLLDAASFRIEQGLEGSAITAPTGTVTATAGGTFSGLRAVLSELGLKENRLKDIDASHENLLTLLTDQVAKLEDADPYESITKIQGLQAQLTSSFQVTAALRQLTLSNFI